MTVIYKKMTQTQMIVVGYLLLILLGSILLMLPVSSRDGNMTSFADALFTSTSASCLKFQAHIKHVHTVLPKGYSNTLYLTSLLT